MLIVYSHRKPKSQHETKFRLSLCCVLESTNDFRVWKLGKKQKPNSLNPFQSIIIKCYMLFFFFRYFWSRQRTDTPLQLKQKWSWSRPVGLSSGSRPFQYLGFNSWFWVQFCFNNCLTLLNSRWVWKLLRHFRNNF